MSVTKVTGMMQTGTKGGDIPSASTLVIDTDGDYFDITGTTGITAMTVDAGRRFTLQFDGAVTLTHGSSLYLPGATNFTTEANDCLSFIATAANTVRCTGYALKDGGSPVAASAGFTVLGAKVATTSGTNIDISGIPTGVSMVVIGFMGVSCASTINVTVQLGIASGLVSSGYISGSARTRASNYPESWDSTSGFLVATHSSSAGFTWNGSMILTRMDTTGTDAWVSSHSMYMHTYQETYGGGYIADLGGDLSQLRLRCGGHAFDAGHVNVTYL